MKRRTIALALTFTIVAIQAYRVLEDSGLLTPLTPHFAGTCEPVEGLIGAEDITIDHARKYAFISADDRRANIAGQPALGAIYGLDLSNPKAKPRLLFKGQPSEGISKGPVDDFHPHGISLYHDDNGQRSLFVVNHPNSGPQQINIFDISDDNSMNHRASIGYPDLVSPNDLIAVGPSQFYVTNDHAYAPGNPMQLIEDYLGLPLSNVSYYDGTHGSIVATGLRYANGITATNNLKTFYVSHATGRKISVYNRDSNTNKLIKQSDIAVKFGPDNLEWGPQNNLWVAGHPRLFDFLAHTNNAGNNSPSQVVKINLNSTQPVTSNIYLSMGADISGATVAAVYDDPNGKEAMLIGSVYEPRILRCQL